MGDFNRCRKRYIVQVKRKNTREKWSEWTRTADPDAAAKHANKIEELGYSSRIVDTKEKKNG